MFGGQPGGENSVQAIQQRQAEMAQHEAQRESILEQILEPSAKVRIQRLHLVKKEKARAIEDTLITAATSGKLREKVTEEYLISMLEQISGGSSSGGDVGDNSGNFGKKKTVIQRRKYGVDDSDDEDDSDMM